MQGHGGRAPMHVAIDTSDRPHHVLDNVNARRRGAFRTPREIADRPFSLGRPCRRPGEARRAPKRAAPAPAGPGCSGPCVFYTGVGIKYIRWAANHNHANGSSEMDARTRSACGDTRASGPRWLTCHLSFASRSFGWQTREHSKHQ
jgi:hypothetical protein